MLEYAIDTISGITAAGLVAPLVALVDKSIISHASGRQELSQGLRLGLKSLLTEPLKFVNQRFVIYVWGVYSGTYVVANLIESVCINNDRSWQYPKFIGTSIANICLGILKDKELTKMFGSKQSAPRSVPIPSYFLFLSRDLLTIGASFNIPPMISTYMQQTWKLPKHFSDVSAQLVTPLSVQVVSTPMHLLALDLYNRPGVCFEDRRVFIGREYWKATFARMGRIFPAFGVGGVSNKALKENLKRALL